VHGEVIFDSVTGRYWYAGNKLNRKAHTWNEALSLIRELNDGCYGSYHDWRLPNIRELESLVDDSRHSPALAKGFLLPGFQVEGYWSSTTSVYEPRYAWVLYLIDGAIGVGYKPEQTFIPCPCAPDVKKTEVHIQTRFGSMKTRRKFYCVKDIDIRIRPHCRTVFNQL
jgi:hypothetical protein